MIPWPFIAFTFIFIALVCAHFLIAYRSWRNSRGVQVSDIDHSYVRLEDYFARSFRMKVAEWVSLPVHAALPGGIRIILKGRERIRLSGSSEYPPLSQSDEILVVRGSLVCGAGCTFNSEIYVSADAHIGAGSKLQSIAADGNLTLGNGVYTTRWADSAQELEIGTNSYVGVRATAGKSIRLREGAQVGSAIAPTVVTGHLVLESGEKTAEFPVPELELPESSSSGIAEKNPTSDGLDRQKLRKLSADCWVYTGDFKPAVALRVTTKLIVKGDCVLPAKSVLEGDLKADGLIEVGEHSVCRGSVIAGGAIEFARASRFCGVVHAGNTLQLCSGVRGGNEESQVAVFAAETLTLECGVVVHGKLASGDRVVITEGARTQTAGAQSTQREP